MTGAAVQDWPVQLFSQFKKPFAIMWFQQMSYVSVYDQSINNHKTLAYCPLETQTESPVEC